MVKVGGRMQASPFALQLVDDVQPILNSIKRVLKLPEPFHPASSIRIFRVGCPFAARILPQVVNRLQAQAPHASVEWLSTPRQVYAAVSEGLIDLAHLGGEMALPDGLDEVELPPLRFVSLVRDGHPGLSIPPFRARFFWSSRTTTDPALIGVRDLVLDAYRSAHPPEAEALFQDALRTGAARTPA